jgi:hypothetical protein
MERARRMTADVAALADAISSNSRDNWAGILHTLNKNGWFMVSAADTYTGPKFDDAEIRQIIVLTVMDLDDSGQDLEELLGRHDWVSMERITANLKYSQSVLNKIKELMPEAVEQEIAGTVRK